MSEPVSIGDVVLVDLSPVAGREHGGRRPALVVSHRRYRSIPWLFLGVPLTSTDRGLLHHVPIASGTAAGLVRTSYAMTDQLRALSVRRIDRQLGRIDDGTLRLVTRYLHQFIA
jgi:mRNA interferase MazF